MFLECVLPLKKDRQPSWMELRATTKPHIKTTIRKRGQGKVRPLTQYEFIISRQAVRYLFMNTQTNSQTVVIKNYSSYNPPSYMPRTTFCTYKSIESHKRTRASSSTFLRWYAIFFRTRMMHCTYIIIIIIILHRSIIIYGTPGDLKYTTQYIAYAIFEFIKPKHNQHKARDFWIACFENLSVRIYSYCLDPFIYMYSWLCTRICESYFS